MLHPSTKKLIDRLAEMTERGKLSWAESDAGPIYATEGYSVQLAAESGDLVITSKDGKELERASAEELNATPTDAGGTYAGVVGLMAKEALRVARGTETAISSLLAGIDQESEEVEAAPTIEVEPETEESQVEDVVDDTQVIAADEIPEIELEPVEEIETAEPAVEAATIDLDPGVETETGMQDAVARLANEVNNRENTVAEPIAEPAVETAPSTPHHYVPFGLNGASLATDENSFVPISDTGIIDVAEEETAPTTDPEMPAVDIVEAPAFVQPEAAETVMADTPSDAAPEASIALEAAPLEAEQPPEQPQSFSLSGIGAGFGLGALTATTEATGAPSMSAPPAEEKIVIDATDDVPFTTPEQSEEAAPETGLPDVSTLDQPMADEAPEPAEPSAPEQADAEEAADLKPRTRFNPWN